MTLDPAAPKGREIVSKLVATADVVVANLPPRGVALAGARSRQPAPDQARHHPDHGDRVRRRRAAEPQARLRRHRPGDERRRLSVRHRRSSRSRIKVPWVDFGTAFLSAFGTLAALIERGKTGRGQKVEGALLRTAIAFSNATADRAGADRRSTAPRPSTAASTRRRPIIFRTKDGWIVATVIGAADVPPLVPDDRRGALARRPALRRRPVARRSRRGHLGADERDGAPSGAARRRSPRSKRPASSPARSIRRSRRSTTRISAPPDLLEERDFPGLDKTVPLAPTPIELSETPGTYRRPAPLVGEHTDADPRRASATTRRRDRRAARRGGGVMSKAFVKETDDDAADCPTRRPRSRPGSRTT